mmetsp:Transcript_62546/g.116290  ORF Transcript_62546/g.116290 Transcript_62546/m.116290 type:complete len:156 (+) Transcript_62546:76-543(+)
MAINDDGVLEADVSGTAALRGLPSEEHRESDDFCESAQRLEREIAKAGTEGPQSQQWRAVCQAEQLGREMDRNLEAELETERARNSAAAESVPPPTPLEQEDPYEKALEAEIEDHLCELRIQERREAEEISVRPASGKNEQVPPALPAFEPEPRK